MALMETHVHTAPTYNGSGGAPNGIGPEVDRLIEQALVVTVDKAGSHSHTISVSDTGELVLQQYVLPYLSFIYERTV